MNDHCNGIFGNCLSRASDCNMFKTVAGTATSDSTYDSSMCYDAIPSSTASLPCNSFGQCAGLTTYPFQPSGVGHSINVCCSNGVIPDRSSGVCMCPPVVAGQ